MESSLPWLKEPQPLAKAFSRAPSASKEQSPAQNLNQTTKLLGGNTNQTTLDRSFDGHFCNSFWYFFLLLSMGRSTQRLRFRRSCPGARGWGAGKCPERKGHFEWTTHRETLGGLLKWGVPPHHPLFSRIFHSNLSSYWGITMAMETFNWGLSSQV